MAAQQGCEVGKRINSRVTCYSSVGGLGKSCRRPKSCRTSTVPGALDANVPGVPSLCSRRAEALTKPFQTVRDRQVRDEFYILVAELPGEPHTKRATVNHWKLIAVHAVAKKRLRMQSIGHIDAVPGIRFH